MVEVTDSLKRWPVTWPLDFRVTARRPASWLAAIIGCAATMAARPLDAMSIAVLATVTAAGDLSDASSARSCGGGLAVRMVWPLMGVVVGIATSPGDEGMLACLAVLVTASTLWIVRRAGATGADLVSIAMVTATAGLMAGVATDSIAASIAVWGALSLGAAWLLQVLPWRTAADHLPRSGGGMVAGPTSPSVVHRLLGWLAMATMLLAMVGWLLLDPTMAGWAAAVGIAWMLSLAVPVAVLGDRMFEAGSAWTAVLQSTPRQWPGRMVIGSSGRPLIETVVRHAAVLGWPALVAAAVMANSQAGPWPAMLVVAGVVVVALVVLLAAVVCQRLMNSRETAFAVVLAAMSAALLLFPTLVEPVLTAVFLPAL